jgi:hypothetical protein
MTLTVEKNISIVPDNKKTKDFAFKHANVIKPSFTVPELKVYPHLTMNCNDPQSIISVLNSLHLRFPSVHCPNKLHLTDT